MSLTCPSCGSGLPAKSRFSAFFVCGSCQSTLVKTDAELQSMGVMATLQADMSPLQIGTEGHYKGKRFSLVGRQRVRWDDGYWNEWYGLMDDLREIWIGEFQGLYAVSFAKDKSFGLPLLKDISVKKTIRFADGRDYEVDDIRETVCVGSEGELPFKAMPGQKATSVDLSDADARFVNLLYEDDQVLCFAGEYLDYDDFAFKSVRAFDGW